jgi:hypothetical protein
VPGREDEVVIRRRWVRRGEGGEQYRGEGGERAEAKQDRTCCLTSPTPASFSNTLAADAPAATQTLHPNLL